MPRSHSRQIKRTPSQHAIEELALKRFAFLLDEQSFTFGTPVHTLYGTANLYLGVRIGVEVTVEFTRDCSVQVDAIRTQNGQLLPDWDKLAVHQRWRYPVVWLLKSAPDISSDSLGRIDRLTKHLDPENPATYDAPLSAIADQLRKAIDYLAVQPYETLFPW